MQINYSNFLEFIVSNRWKSKSQISQDLFVLYFTQQKKDGYFIEIGACDGKHLSNTFSLEKRGWTGIICEPSNFWLQKIKNRKCILSKKAVFSESGKKLIFNEVPKHPELSGFNDYLDNDNNSKLRKDFSSYEVETISLNDLISEHVDKKQIDYISIDTEGSEFEILKNFDFKKQQVEIFTIEHNFLDEKRAKIFKIMTENNYKRVFETLSHWDDWYVKKDNTVLKSMIDYK